jgi:hypothetical protein
VDLGERLVDLYAHRESFVEEAVSADAVPSSMPQLGRRRRERLGVATLARDDMADLLSQWTPHSSRRHSASCGGHSHRAGGCWLAYAGTLVRMIAMVCYTK